MTPAMFLNRYDRYEIRLYRRNRRRRELAASLAVLLILIGLGIGHRAPAHARPRHRPHPAASRRPRPTPARPRTGASPGLRWASFHGIALPASAHDGPRHTDAGRAWGFTRTRDGALLAAVNIAVRTAAQWGPDIYGPTIRRQVTGRYASALLKADDSDYAALRAAARVRPGEPAGRGYAAEVAYRITARAPGAATVDIVTEGPGAGITAALAVTRIQVTWQDGDWRVVAPPRGSWASSASPLRSLHGYTTFPGER